jgi:alkanesulfonate monooxygenase SsuD/methylene tetrahydromethanopterin reductase-like flavin-dependent oxidoreductase (luciferase family)
MVQQMIRNDPRLANNPMLQQSLDALQSNPDMIRQFSSMMNDPGVRANVSRMMQQQQQAGGAGASGGVDPFAGGPEDMRRQMQQFQEMQGNSGSFNLQPQQQNGQQPSQGSGGNSNNANDSEMTEEEMIAEAIARSLRES